MRQAREKASDSLWYKDAVVYELHIKSFHDSNEALKKIILTGYPEVITLQYNILDRQLEEGIALACEKGIGIVVMGPVGGGRLGEPSEALANVLPGVKRVPELALRFVLANPHVCIALSGMSTLEQVEENVRVASDTVALTAEDHAAINRHLDKLKAMADENANEAWKWIEVAVSFPYDNARGLRELGTELAERQGLRAVADQREGGDVPERGRPAIAEDDRVALGEREQVDEKAIVDRLAPLVLVLCLFYTSPSPRDS